MQNMVPRELKWPICCNNVIEEILFFDTVYWIWWCFKRRKVAIRQVCMHRRYFRNRKWKECLNNPSPHLAIDETLYPYRSAIGIKQYNPSKPVSTGFSIAAYVMLLCLIRSIHSPMRENHQKQTMKHPNIIFQRQTNMQVPCKWCKSLQFHRWIQHVYWLVFHIGNYSSMGIRKDNNNNWYNAIRS